ncbi:MAG TPA: PRC-barrel domain-containing protein [Solirubrobacteraceae bacterium]|jgi:hypothetical protein
MTAPIDDVTSLPGRKVTDQEENTIGEVKEIYAIDGDGYPMWVTVEASSGMSEKKTVFIPLARLKEEDGDLRVPYSKDHILSTPEVDGSDGISDECDRQLRDHYGIDRADQELRSHNDSYATLVPEDEEGTAKLADDADSLETPDSNKVDEETRERLEDVGSAEMRHVTAEDVVEDDQGSDEGSSESGDEQKSDGGEEDDDESKSESDDESKSESESAEKTGA